MKAAVGRPLQDIVELHIDELSFLWERREASVRSPTMTWARFLELEDRVEAHVDGILVAGSTVFPRLLAHLAAGTESGFAPAYPLLRSGAAAGSAVLDTLPAAADDRLEGLTAALSHGPLDDRNLRRLWALLDSRDGGTATAAMEALTFHSALRLTPRLLRELVRTNDPVVRRRGWRLAGLGAVRLDTCDYTAAFECGDIAALQAAAWAGAPIALEFLRAEAAVRPERADLLELLAVLGTPADLTRFHAVGREDSFGARRFRLIGTYGNPALVDVLIAAMREAPPEEAAAAASAFTRMTGVDVSSGEFAAAPAADADDADALFEAEFRLDIPLPDPDRARAHWNAVRHNLGGAERVCGGFDVSLPLPPADAADFDMQSRWEVFMRASFAGGWRGSPRDLEMFPQRGGRGSPSVRPRA